MALAAILASIFFINSSKDDWDEVCFGGAGLFFGKGCGELNGSGGERDEFGMVAAAVCEEN